MNYKKVYKQIIKRAQERKNVQGYSEIHHIIPVSEGGKNEPENLVELTAREHFICHWLLYRQDQKSYTRAEAFRMMCDIDPSSNKERYIPSSRAVAEARKASAELKSRLYRQKCWVKKAGVQKFIYKEVLPLYLAEGWQRGKNYKPTEETREKIRQVRLNAPKPGKDFSKKMSKIVKKRYEQNPESWKKSKETREKISLHNKLRDPAYKKKISETRKKQIVTCPHCGKVGNNSIMQRWHFNKCKNKRQ
jgi:predicted SprT family Zn-dependent metalloprotease